MSTKRRRNPWWIPPFLGAVPDIEPTLISTLGVVALAMFFENYDYSLLGSALKAIAEDLGIPEARLGYFTAAIRLGALPAFFAIPVADRIGRRRTFLAAVVGLAAGTFLTAFSANETQFLIIQMLTRTCMLVAAAMAFVIVSEEFPAEHRGWGIGMLAAVGSFGHGLGALLFALIDVLPYGWRALYIVGVGPILLLPRLRKGIRETDRFTRHDQGSEERAKAGWFAPLTNLFRERPARAIGLLSAGAFVSFGHAVVFAFIGYFVMTVHGWEPWQYSVMVIVCGLFGIVGNVAGGRLSDRFGRRNSAFVVLVLFPVFAWMFFRGPGWSLPVTWIALVFATLATNVILRALSTELFPTSQRGTAAGAMALAETLGAAAGLAVLGLVTERSGDLASTLPAVASVTLLGAVIVLFFPETSRRELEIITGETDLDEEQTS